MSHETIATLKEASTPPSREQLLIEVSQDIMSMVNQKQNPLAGFKPDSSALAGTLVLDELGRERHPSSEGDSGRSGRVPSLAARRGPGAADAAKEGGFMGFGAVRVSEGEPMLEKLHSTLGVS